MIRFEEVGFRYADGDHDVLTDVNLEIPEGDMCLVVGGTGSGKSTLLGAVNGLVPRFTGGTLSGVVTVDGRSTADHRLRELADVVGYVPQNPARSFVSETVEDELAYGMEQLGVAPQVMRKRVEEILDLLGIVRIRSRSLESISGGEQQRVAIGAALASGPRVLVLDEPTSALDPLGAEEVLASVLRLVHDLGVTAMISEHRLERIVDYADSAVVLDGTGRVLMGPPAEMMVTSPVAPPVVELGRALDWQPLPLSVRDGRRMAAGITLAEPVPVIDRNGPGDVVVSAVDLRVRYGKKVAIDGVDLDLCAGSVTALMGRNGSGKSSLLWALQGYYQEGEVSVDGQDPRRVPAEERRHLVGLVPQDPADLLFAPTVAAECDLADGGDGRCRRLLDRMSPGIDQQRAPYDLSEGQRLALAISVQLSTAPRLMLLDEPTRGLDYGAKRHLGELLAEIAAEGTVLVATHDVEFVAEVAEEVVILAQGEIVASGPTSEIVTTSDVFAPQMVKILGSTLTVGAAVERIAAS
ncbi:MAG: ATP-binding cassette domain-containing protein [Acidimicrobiia bacterium]|nr:ATP-binding cassette domain-containing protein [Acidimicrobiia bacterium]